MSSTHVREEGSFHTMAARKMFEMSELFLMSTDSPLPPPLTVSKSVKMSPTTDVKSAYESPNNSMYNIWLNVVCNLIFSKFFLKCVYKKL
jgi:hypothetical protein